jgi:hypothetical protein
MIPLEKLIKRIARHLPGWRCASRAEKQQCYSLVQRDGMGALFIRHLSGPMETSDRTMLEICAQYDRILDTRGKRVGPTPTCRPSSFEKKYDRNDGHYHIRVRQSRGPETIAREITRRVFPGYLARLANLEHELKTNNSEIAVKDRVAKRLRDLLQFATLIDNRDNPNINDDRVYAAGPPGSGEQTINIEAQVDNHGVIDLTLGFLTATQAAICLAPLLRVRSAVGQTTIQLRDLSENHAVKILAALVGEGAGVNTTKRNPS